VASKPCYKGEAGCLVAVIDNWEQLHTNGILLKPAKHCYSLFSALQGHEKPSGKADMAIYSYSAMSG